MAFAVTVGPSDGTTQAPGSTPSVTLNGCTAGNSIIVGVRWYHATVTITSVTITSESNATVHGSPTKNASLNNATHQFASLGNITTSGNKTITANLSGSADAATVFAMEVSGGNTSGFFDVEGGSTGNSANGSTSITTSNAGALIVASESDNAGGATQGSGFTVITLGESTWWDEGEYKLDAGAAGSKTVDFVHSSGQWVVKAAAFNAAGGGGGSANILPFTPWGYDGMGGGRHFGSRIH